MATPEPLHFAQRSRDFLTAWAVVDSVPMVFSHNTAPKQTSFADRLKELRLRFGGKQWWLAYAAGCTDAAVSFWEAGKRIPTARMLSRIVEVLMLEGAPPGELALLQRSWREAKLSRHELRGYPPAGPRLAT